jgi:DNA invertase Pin-like site-specific DNA recombinase
LVALDLGLDLTTPQGEMVAHVMASFAQFERRLIGQRTRDALAARRADGVRLGRPPSLPARVVDRIVRERDRRITLAGIAGALNADGVATAQGGAKWYPSTVAAVLRSAARVASA